MLNIPKCLPVKVAITCHDLISGNDPANIQEMDRTGLSTAQARKVPPLKIVYPAELDMRATIENLIFLLQLFIAIKNHNHKTLFRRYKSLLNSKVANDFGDIVHLLLYYDYFTTTFIAT